MAGNLLLLDIVFYPVVSFVSFGSGFDRSFVGVAPGSDIVYYTYTTDAYFVL